MAESFYNAEAEKKAAEAKKEADLKHARDIGDLRKLIELPEGRRFVWNQLARAGVFSPSFTLNSVQTGYNEGARSVGIALLADLMEAKPEAFYQMFREANSEAKSKKQEEANG